MTQDANGVEEIGRQLQRLALEGNTAMAQKLPKPDIFDGNRGKYPGWRVAMANKLRVDGEAIGAEDDKFSYIYSRLSGAAQQLAVPYVEQHSGMHADSAAFLAYLDTTYKDPNQKARALVALRALTQKPNESFAVFLPRFEQLLAEAGMVAADNATKINYLDGALNEKIQNAVIAIDHPDTYHDWVCKLQEIGSRIDALRVGVKPLRVNPFADTKVSSSMGYEEMDWEPTGSTRIARARVRSAWEEKLFREKRCFKCFCEGHRISACPNVRGVVPPRFRHLLRETGEEAARVNATKAVFPDDDPDARPEGQEADFP